MRVILIRHGKTEGNLQKRYIGKTDEPLCHEGKAELEEVSDRLREYGVQKVFSSPMKRCLETAAVLFSDLGLTVMDDFRETDFGLFEGKNYEELKDNPEYKKWIESNGTIGFPGGETRDQALKRAAAGFEKMLVVLGSDGNRNLTAAAVIHGGTIMAILSSYCGGDFYDYQVKNAEGFVFEVLYENGKIKLYDLRKL